MAIWQSGRTWYQLAPVARLTLTGKAPVGVTGKDIVLALCALFKTDVLNHAVEINATPETLASIPIDSRLTISNMSTEWGALSCREYFLRSLFPLPEAQQADGYPREIGGIMHVWPRLLTPEKPMKWR